MTRTGFTLLEVLVALTVFAVAVLAYVGAVASVSRSLGRSAVRQQVAAMVQDALERPRLVWCAGGSGVTRRGPISLQWRASARGVGVDVTAVVRWAYGGTVRVDTFRTSAPCI